MTLFGPGLEATRAALDFRRKAAVVEECKAEKRAMVLPYGHRTQQVN